MVLDNRFSNTVITHELDAIFTDFWYKDEDYFRETLKRLVDATSRDDYFMCVDDCLRKLITTKDPFIVSKLANLALTFYRHVDTTEATPILLENGKAVSEHIEKYGDKSSFELLEFIKSRLPIKENRAEEIPSLFSQPVLICYPQGFHHDTAYIVGNKEGFMSLRNAVKDAIKYNKSTIELIATDGVNYQLKLGITPSPEIIELAEMPYSEQYSHSEESKVSPKKICKIKKEKRTLFSRIRGGH